MLSVFFAILSILISWGTGLDSLNRRVGIGSAPGISIWEDADKDAVVDAGELLAQTHVLDERGGLTGLDDGTTVEPVDQDISGAITQLHDTKLYHDWLGRPILALDADTGDPIFAVEYDGFGRVAQRRAPWPDNNPTLTKQRIETYFYDGVRRIQEVFADPIAAIPPWPVEVPVGGLGGYVGDLVRTEAEYIWSAASGQPFDTCHVQIDWWDREAWFVQDHQAGTVRAYTDANGEMVRQYRFDAFGNLLNLDTFPLASGSGLFASFRNRLGHQGLFAERVDGDTTQLTLSPNPNAQVWYQSRSRWYVPELGRFMTSDPNATGVPTMNSLAMLGTTPTGPPSGSFDWESHYGDGWDTWTSYGANPVMGQDPSGLFWGLVGLGVAQGLDSGLSALDGLGMVADGYQARNRLMGQVGIYHLQQAMLMDLMDTMFSGDGAEFTASLATYTATVRIAGRGGFGGFRLANSVWNLSPIERGRVIEQQLGMNLHQNFPGIDAFDFNSGEATSIKSIDTNAPSYRRDSAIRSRIRKYIRDLDRFKNAGDIAEDMIKSKTLKIAVPANASENHVRAIRSQRGYARTRRIRIRIVRIP